MAIERARAYLARFGLAERIRVTEESSATVPLAAAALGVEEGRIAKTLAFDLDGRTLLIVMAGDKKVDNARFRAAFGKKAKMLAFEETEARVGHAAGGICPFGINEGVEVCLDASLKRFDRVFPACGSPFSSIGLSLEELEATARPIAWVDVGK